LLLGLALIGTAPWCAALNIGKVHGSAWIGQPLDVSVPLELDAGQAATDLCPQADVFHGEMHQDNALVRVTIEAGARPDGGLLRIRSAARVDEPVVTVNLRLGCTQKTAYRLVLLADYPNTSANSNANAIPRDVPTVNASVVASAPVATPRPVPYKPARRAPMAMPDSSEGIELTLASSLSFESSALLSRSKKKKHGHQGPDTDTTTAQALHAATPHKARLKLDPVEPLPEHVNTLEASKPSDPGAIGATSASSAPLGPQEQQLEALQADLKSLIEQASKNEIAMASMRARLEHTESDRGPVILAYSLLTLMGLGLLGALLLWARRYVPLLRKKRSTQI
jgi:hypothetical protein